MKISPPNAVTFTFSKEKEEVYSQAEFFLIYYTARLKMLKAENLNLYITAEQAAEEIFYKDMISACMLFLQEKKTFKTTEHETTTGTGEKLSRDLPTGELSRTNTDRREHISPAPSPDGRRE